MTTRWEPFRRDRSRHVPAASGRDALATVQGTIVYLGLTTHLRSRMEQHLDGPAKRAVTAHGRAAVFHWRETGDLRAVERGRLNSHRVAARVWPILNKVASVLQPDGRAPGAGRNGLQAPETRSAAARCPGSWENGAGERDRGGR